MGLGYLLLGSNECACTARQNHSSALRVWMDTGAGHAAGDKSTRRGGGGVVTGHQGRRHSAGVQRVTEADAGRRGEAAYHRLSVALVLLRRRRHRRQVRRRRPRHRDRLAQTSSQRGPSVAVLRPTCCHSRWDRPLTGVNVIDIQ